jgi:hypothetical protein
METVPPPAEELSPAERESEPPDPVSPVPTAIVTDPAYPAVDAPLVREIAPELPLLDVPVEKSSRPLEPATPALLLCIFSEPLEDAKPVPEEMDTDPPIALELSPALRTKDPPAPVPALPTSK